MPGYHGDHEVSINGDPIEMDMIHYNQVDEGLFEVIDTQPKKEYYMSLRRPGNTLSSFNNGSLYGDGHSASGLAHSTDHVKLQSNTMLSHTGSLKSNGSKWGFKGLSKKVVDTMKNALGQQLFDAVCNHLELLESQFFGLAYRDKKNNWHWLKMDKMISKQIEKSSDWQFEFQVRFYPYDIESIREYLTRYYLCLQVRQDIVSGQLPCSFYVYALLGGYIVQSEAGDHNPREHIGIEYIRDHPFAPQGLQTQEMLTQIVAFHKRNRGQAPEEADRHFLNNARRLALYGVDMHRVKFGGSHSNLGVNHEGIVIYRNRLVLHRFSWPSIIRLGYRGTQFSVTVDRRDRMAMLPPSEQAADAALHGGDTNANEKTFKFESASQQSAKRMFRTCKDRHEFFRLTRAPRKASLLPTFAARKYQFSGRYFGNRGPYEEDTFPPPQATANIPRTQGKFTRMPNYRHWDQSGFGEQYDFHPYIPNHSPGVMKNMSSTPYDHGYFSSVDTMRTNGATPHIKVHTWQQNQANDENDGTVNGYMPERPKLPKCGWRISMSDRTERLGIDPSGLDLEDNPGWGWQGCRANMGVRGQGGYYFEVRILKAGLVRVGWSTNDSNLNCGLDACGFAYGASTETATCPTDPSSGLAMHNKQAVPYGPILKQGDVVGCYLDLDKGSVFWSVNEQVYSRCFTIPRQVRDETFIPTFSVNGARVLINFGLEPMEYRPRDPYYSPVALCQTEHQLPNRNVGWRLNSMDSTEHMDVSANGFTVQSKLGMGWQGIRCNRGVHGPDRYYFECQSLEIGGKCRVGWSLEEANLELGTDALGFGFGADHCSSPDSANYSGIDGQQSKLVHGGDISPAGPAIRKGDVIGCCLDLKSRCMRWSINGQFVKEADVNLDQFLKQAEADSPLLPVVFFPVVNLLDSTLEVNFGSTTFKHYPGNECTPVCEVSEEHFVQSKKRLLNYGTRGWSYFEPCILNEDIKAHNRIGQEAAIKAASRTLDRQESKESSGRTQHSNGTASQAAIQAELAAALGKRMQKRKSQTMHSNDGETVASESVIVSAMSSLPVSRVSASDSYTFVQQGEPEVYCETYEQPDGNVLTRKVTKTKIITTKKYSQMSGQGLPIPEPNGIYAQEDHQPQPPVPHHSTPSKSSSSHQSNGASSLQACTDAGAKLRCTMESLNSDAELNKALNEVLSLSPEHSLSSVQSSE
ncbi:DEAD (Asp-Glu-Ala-Asp) box helicase 1, partial [Cichlidogyrus casuarinus]